MAIEQLTYIDNTKIKDITLLSPNAKYQDKVDVAIALLQAWEPPEGYYLAFSGGKDSVAIFDLAVKAGVKFDAHYCVSPIDPKAIHDFIRQDYPDVQWDYHARGFWKLVDKKGLPMRQSRWCCQIIKESGGSGRVVVLGNRRVEGNIRRNQCFVEIPTAGRVSGKKHKTFIRPILDFDNSDIWQYIRENKINYCTLYDEGFKRLGCVLCPFSRDITREEIYFLKIVKLWKLACNRIVKAQKERGYLTLKGKPVKNRFESGQDLYNWWVSRR